MTKKEESQYRDVLLQMTDRTLALASQVAADAVKNGIPYRLAHHAVTASLYQGLFGATLRGMKNDGLFASSVKMEDAFISTKEHEQVAHKIIEMIFDHLRATDKRFVWAINTVRREVTSKIK